MADNGEALLTIVEVSIDPPKEVNLEKIASLSGSALVILTPFCLTQTGGDE